MEEFKKRIEILERKCKDISADQNKLKDLLNKTLIALGMSVKINNHEIRRLRKELQTINRINFN